MLLKYSIASLLLLAGIVLALRCTPRADPAETSSRVVQTVLQALERGDYDAFIAQGDKGVSKLSEENFRLLVDRNAPRLRQGHSLQPLDTRWRGNVHITRWKIIFKDGSPAATLTLGVRDGKVATFAML